MKTLVIDDNRVFRRVMDVVLSPYSRVVFAENGRDGLRAFEKALKETDPCDLICMDVNMPYPDGIETLRLLRGIEKSWQIRDDHKAKVLLITASMDRKHIYEAINYQCDGYLVKPLNKEAFLSKLLDLGFSLKKREIPAVPEAPPQRPRNKATLKLLVPVSDAIWNGQTLNDTDRKPINYFKLFQELKPILPGRVIAEVVGFNNDTDPPDYGEGLFFEKRQNLLVARAAGRLESRNGVPAINDTIVVRGDVGPRSGNVDFPGVVRIEGDVKDGFRVRGRKGVFVSGNVGAAHIESEGDIEIDAAHGHCKGSIRCGGDFYGRLLYDIDIESRGDITITGESLCCDLKARGTIVCPNGTLAGGRCVALRGIEAAIIGREDDLPTVLILGADYLELDRVERLNRDLEAKRQEVQALERHLGVYAAPSLPETFAALAAERKTNVLEGRKKRVLVGHQILRLERLLEKKPEEVPAPPVLKVANAIYRGVRVSIGEISKLLYEKQTGPCRVVVNAANAAFDFPPDPPPPNAAAAQPV